ncbi:MAG: ABC transporter ATP-binding protein [Chloroflexota bacterium]|nr:MAG: ABC transporter ATP-binding protein [Chloroflexota bacterium]
MSILRVEQLSFQYLQANRNALRAVTCEFEPGTVTAIVGANGAGKSTLCFALAGFIPHFFRGKLQGKVYVNGADTQQTPLAQLVTQVGMVFQNPFNQISGAKLTVSEEVAFGLENLGIARAEMETRVARTLQLFDLQHVAQQSPFALSGGQQQRLALASIFIMEPPVMILDEPTAQLDPHGTRQVMKTIQTLAAHGRTIVLVEHKLEWVARLAARVLVLDKGALVADGEPRAILSRANAWGLIETRYARAARAAMERGLIEKKELLPQTLEQAKDWFQIEG